MQNKEYITAIKQILEISIRQKELLSENRLNDLLELQKKRDALASSIKGYSAPEDAALKKEMAGIVKQILDNDSILKMKIMSSMEDIKTELKSTIDGKKVVKAYKSGV